MNLIARRKLLYENHFIFKASSAKLVVNPFSRHTMQLEIAIGFKHIANEALGIIKKEVLKRHIKKEIFDEFAQPHFELENICSRTRAFEPDKEVTLTYVISLEAAQPYGTIFILHEKESVRLNADMNNIDIGQIRIESNDRIHTTIDNRGINVHYNN